MFGIAKSWSKPGATARIPEASSLLLQFAQPRGKAPTAGKHQGAHTASSRLGEGRGNIHGLVSVPGHRSSGWLGLAKEQLSWVFCVQQCAPRCFPITRLVRKKRPLLRGSATEQIEL